MDDDVVVLALCESEALYLRPNVKYLFQVVDDCKRCSELEIIAKG